MHGRTRVPVLAVALALGCGTAAVEGPSGRSQRATEAEPGSPPPDRASREAAPLAPGRIRYDLAAHADRAELREGDTLAVDLGARGGARHTLGGWQTGMVDAELDGVTVALATGARGKLRIGWEGTGDGALVLRARRFRTPVQLYLDDHALGELALPEDGSFGVVRVTLPAARLAQGEHTLLFRSSGTGPVPGGGRASVAIDWMRLGPAGETDNESAVADPLALAGEIGGAPMVRIPEGSRLGWTMEVPRDARLRGLVAGSAGARVSVVAHLDGAEPRLLGRADAREDGARMDLPLDHVAEKVARIELRAEGGEVRVVRPAVITLDARTAAETPRARNVLVYLIDTLRADKLSPYNPSTRVRTPGLGRFLERATTLERAHTQENWTKPSVATLLSSLMPWEHTAVRGESVVPASVVMLPELLKERGFYTGSFIANGYVSDRFGFGQGWDTYRNYIREGRRTPAQYVAADVLEWLDDRPADEPFFLYVHTIDPHVPYRPPAEYVGMYGDAGYRGRVDFRRDATLLENIKLGRIRLGPADKAQLEALYDGEITYHDVHFAAILEGLERRGLADDTIVVVTSDHGEEFWDHGSVGHGHNVYEELLHIPMFVRLPGANEVRAVDAPVGLVDVVPTVLEALGQEVPEAISGRSFLPLLLGRDEPAPRSTVSGFMETWRTIVVGRHKLIQRTADTAMLHDLAEDPGEQRDIARERPIVASHLRAMLGLTLAETPEASAPSAPRARRRPQHRAEGTRVDGELADQLRALGYVDDWR